MAQSISNLLRNALRHGAPGEPIVVRADGAEPGEISVSVRNGGAQIPKASRDGLFEPMARGADARQAGHNLGLGLYFVREIALAHGGSVGVESDAGSGTIFAVRMPREAGGAAASGFPRMHMG